VLGTGLHGLGERIERPVRIPYVRIPNFPRSTAPGHAGSLAFGAIDGVPVAVMEGRFHFYEGYPLRDITLPVHAAKALGARALLLTSAVGGMHPTHRLGEIVAIHDHINFMGDSPLRGENDERLGPRFPDMSRPYDAELLDRAESIAHAQGFRLPRAVLVAVPGPQLETRSEYRYLRALGADVVGMSAVPEAIVAAHAGLRTAAFSVVTDLGFPEALEAVSIDRIVAIANAAAPRLERLLLDLLPHV
jgi:purine-nucleoside phosphorylase